MNTYQTRAQQSEPGLSTPARAALALFFLGLIGGLLIALTPVSPAQRMAALNTSERAVLLALSLPEPVIALPLALPAAAEIDLPPLVKPEPIPPAPTVAAEIPAEDEPAAVMAVAVVLADENVVDDVGLPPAVLVEDLAVPEPAEPALTLEDIVMAAAEPAPEPVTEAEPEPSVAVEPEPVVAVEPEAEPAPEPESVVAVEPEPETTLEPEAVVEPELAAAPEPEATAQPVVVAALAVSADDEEPVPYAAGALAPDEAVAMPDDTPPPTITEKAPEPTVAAEDAASAPLIEPAKAPAEPVWLAYARPTEAATDRPRIAVVVTGLGLGRAATAAAIKLPGAITLSFASHARDLQNWIDLARAAGHEVMLDLPMEPENYPQIDPGPQALLTSLSRVENAERLNWHLDRASGYVGVTHNMGSRFTASADHMQPILAALKGRGLMFLDARTTANSVAADLATAIGLPRAINNRFLDAQASRPMIDLRINEIERIARRVGFSVAVSHAYPVTLERLERWVETLGEKKLVLVPVSALANRQAVE